MASVAAAAVRSSVVCRHLGLRDYTPVVEAMRVFTERRTPDQPDELWLLQHPPVFTLGMAGKTEHLLAPGDIPVIRTDRGGQVTYHGPGQLVVYTLIDLKRAQIGVRKLVTVLEQVVVGLLADYGISACSRVDAPGVYVDGRKIASLGLRVRHRCSYHGLSLNVDMDLSPFQRIDPCGYPGLGMTQLAEQVAGVTIEETAERLLRKLASDLGYTEIIAAREADLG